MFPTRTTENRMPNDPRQPSTATSKRIVLSQQIHDPEQAQRLTDQPRAGQIADLVEDMRSEGHCTRRQIERALFR